MNQTDYSKIVLTKEQKRIFEKFSNSNVALLSSDEFHAMKDTSLLEDTICGHSTLFDIICRVSLHGIKYRIYLQEKSEQRKSRLCFTAIILGIIFAAAAVLCIWHN